MTVLLPFLALAALLLEPVLVDTASLFPSFAPWLQWLPVTLFCKGCGVCANACPFDAITMVKDEK